MTYYDAAMAGVVIAGMVWGAWRGITWQVASIASLVLGYMVAHPLSGQLASQFPGDPVVSRALAMLVVYAGVSGGVFLAAWVVRATLRKLQFEAFDRHLGMVLGGCEGALIGLVATFFVVSLAPQTRTPIFSSPTGKVVGQVMSTLGPVLPTEARAVLTRFWDGSIPDEALTADSAEDAKTERPSSSSHTRGTRPDQTAADDSGLSTLPSLIEKEESRISKAIVETAQKELGAATTGSSDGRTVKRR